MDHEKIEALKLFIEKADKLKNSNFVTRIVKRSGVDLSFNTGQKTVVRRRGPDDENIDAFILTFRFFIQDNEPISLRNIKDVFHSDLATEEEKNNFDEARSNLNTYLEGNTMFNINGMIRRRELMEVFIFGGLSHANSIKKEKYDRWMGSDILAPFVQNEFAVIIFEALNIIVFIQNLCEMVLERANSA